MYCHTSIKNIVHAERAFKMKKKDLFAKVCKTLLFTLIIVSIALCASCGKDKEKGSGNDAVKKDQSSLDGVYNNISTALESETAYGYNTAGSWRKLSTVYSSPSLPSEQEFSSELFETVSSKYATDPASIFESDDAKGKVVWIAISKSGKILICLAPDSAGNTDDSIAKKIGFIGNGSPSDFSW